MTTRLGKIAQLPKPIRDDLNRRLDNGHQSPELLEWLNSLPEIQELVATKFEHQPITKSNLSHWRRGGYQDWRADQLREARLQRISESGAPQEPSETANLFENFARMTIAELALDLDALPKRCGEKRTQKLHHLIRDLARLQNSHNHTRRTALAWTKWNQRAMGVSPMDPPLETQNSKPETNSPTTPVAPSSTESQPKEQAGRYRSPELEARTNRNGSKVVYNTRCCHNPCPKCHAPDSPYPMDEVLRDEHYYKANGARLPYDRDGIDRYIINTYCECSCDQCERAKIEPSQNPATAVTPSSAKSSILNAKCLMLNEPPRCPISNHAESHDKNPPPTPSPEPLRPLSPSTPLPAITLPDARQRLIALLKFRQQTPQLTTRSAGSPEANPVPAVSAVPEPEPSPASGPLNPASPISPIPYDSVTASLRRISLLEARSRLERETNSASSTK
jgi:hypothetical protein